MRIYFVNVYAARNGYVYSSCHSSRDEAERYAKDSGRLYCIKVTMK